MKCKYLFILSLIAIISCKKDEVTPRVKKDNIVQPINVVESTVQEFTVDPTKLFGVYQLTNKDFAICQAVDFDNKSVPLSKKYQEFVEKDSLPWIYNRPMGDYKYYDTLYVDRLIYNKRFDEVFRKEMKSEYYVYGTKSFRKAKVTKVVFQSSECGNDYIAYILDIDKNSIGNPVFASETEIPLEYSTQFSDIEKKIRKAIATESTENNYGFGNYDPKVFAHYQNLYFTYYDDFKWYNRKNKSNVQFPDRTIAEISESGKATTKWSSELDLLGLPCL